MSNTLRTEQSVTEVELKESLPGEGITDEEVCREAARHFRHVSESGFTSTGRRW